MVVKEGKDNSCFCLDDVSSTQPLLLVLPNTLVQTGKLQIADRMYWTQAHTWSVCMSRMSTA